MPRARPLVAWRLPLLAVQLPEGMTVAIAGGAVARRRGGCHCWRCGCPKAWRLPLLAVRLPEGVAVAIAGVTVD